MLQVLQASICGVTKAPALNQEPESWIMSGPGHLGPCCHCMLSQHVSICRRFIGPQGLAAVGYQDCTIQPSSLLMQCGGLQCLSSLPAGPVAKLILLHMPQIWAGLLISFTCPSCHYKILVPTWDICSSLNNSFLFDVLRVLCMLTGEAGAGNAAGG